MGAVLVVVCLSILVVGILARRRCQSRGEWMGGGEGGRDGGGRTCDGSLNVCLCYFTQIKREIPVLKQSRWPPTYPMSTVSRWNLKLTLPMMMLNFMTLLHHIHIETCYVMHDVYMKTSPSIFIAFAMALSRKFRSGGNLGPGDHNFWKTVRADHFFSEVLLLLGNNDPTCVPKTTARS